MKLICLVQQLLSVTLWGVHGRSIDPTQALGEEHAYQFRYNVADETTGDFKERTEVRDTQGYVSGYYRFTQPDGCVRVVHYTGDAMGFHPQVTYEGDRCQEKYSLSQHHVGHSTLSTVNTAALPKPVLDNVPGSAYDQRETVMTPWPVQPNSDGVTLEKVNLANAMSDDEIPRPTPLLTQSTGILPVDWKPVPGAGPIQDVGGSSHAGGFGFTVPSSSSGLTTAATHTTGSLATFIANAESSAEKLSTFNTFPAIPFTQQQLEQTFSTDTLLSPTLTVGTAPSTPATEESTEKLLPHTDSANVQQDSSTENLFLTTMPMSPLPQQQVATTSMIDAPINSDPFFSLSNISNIFSAIPTLAPLPTIANLTNGLQSLINGTAEVLSAIPTLPPLSGILANITSGIQNLINRPLTDSESPSNEPSMEVAASVLTSGAMPSIGSAEGTSEMLSATSLFGDGSAINQAGPNVETSTLTSVTESLHTLSTPLPVTTATVPDLSIATMNAAASLLASTTTAKPDTVALPNSATTDSATPSTHTMAASLSSIAPLTFTMTEKVSATIDDLTIMPPTTSTIRSIVAGSTENEATLTGTRTDDQTAMTSTTSSAGTIPVFTTGTVETTRDIVPASILTLLSTFPNTATPTTDAFKAEASESIISSVLPFAESSLTQVAHTGVLQTMAGHPAGIVAMSDGISGAATGATGAVGNAAASEVARVNSATNGITAGVTGHGSATTVDGVTDGVNRVTGEIGQVTSGLGEMASGINSVSSAATGGVTSGLGDVAGQAPKVTSVLGGEPAIKPSMPTAGQRQQQRPMTATASTQTGPFVVRKPSGTAASTVSTVSPIPYGTRLYFTPSSTTFGHNQQQKQQQQRQPHQLLPQSAIPYQHYNVRTPTPGSSDMSTYLSPPTPTWSPYYSAYVYHKN